MKSDEQMDLYNDNKSVINAEINPTKNILKIQKVMFSCFTSYLLVTKLNMMNL